MMKKSKLLRATAKETLENVHLGQATVEMEFKYRHDGPFTLKATRRYFTRYVKALRRDRLFLYAVEKQIPMPVRVHCMPIGGCTWEDEPGMEYVISKQCYCQSCGGLVPEYHFEDRIKYCPYCGQKLWWPK